MSDDVEKSTSMCQRMYGTFSGKDLAIVVSALTGSFNNERA